MDENSIFLVSANKQKTLCEYIVQLMRLFVRFRQVVHVNYYNETIGTLCLSIKLLLASESIDQDQFAYKKRSKFNHGSY